MSGLLTSENLIAFLTLAALEIVLGIDNIVVIAIVTSKLPPEQQRKARNLGLALAMVMRVGLLFAISWVMGLTRTLFAIDLSFMGLDVAQHITGKDIILIGGGLFLIAKATKEIHHKMEGPDPDAPEGAEAAKRVGASFSAAIVQILLLDLVFSLDSVITAVGMAKAIPVMVAAVIVAVIVMMVFAGAISRFVEKHPTIKVLALSFLILIGVLLTADGFGQHLPRGYIYFAMAFSLAVEMINLRVRKTHALGK